MRITGVMGRFLREERGFTLPEMLVTMVIMIVVLFALYNIFDMSVRIFGFGNNEVEAVENARLGLEKMEREIRAAYPVDRNDPEKRYLFFDAGGSTSNPPRTMPTATQMTFGNDLGTESGTIECPNAANCEYITYKLSRSGDTRTLLRNTTSTGSSSSSGGDPVVEFIDGASGLNFAYLKGDGTAAATESEIEIVRITLDVRVEGATSDGTQTLTTDVNLRNRGG